MVEVISAVVASDGGDENTEEDVATEFILIASLKAINQHLNEGNAEILRDFFAVSCPSSEDMVLIMTSY